jgi:adenosylcobinamide-phosphate synthase
MSVIAIIAALLLEQWRPLVERKTYHALLARWANWLEGTFNAGESRHGRIAWAVAAAPLVLGSLALYWIFLWVHPLLALALNVAALYVTLGFRQFSHYFTGIQLAVKGDDLDRARELIGTWRGEASQHRTKEEVVRLAIEEALAASHRHVFAVLFWFMLLPGPSGAILYRLAGFLARRWGGQGAFGTFAIRVHEAMEWPAVRLTAIAFAVVGDFEDAIYCWRTQSANWADARIGIVLAAGAGAMGVRLGMPLAYADGTVEPRAELGLGESADTAFLDSTVGLLWRSLVVWVFLLAVLGVARIF